MALSIPYRFKPERQTTIQSVFLLAADQKQMHFKQLIFLHKLLYSNSSAFQPADREQTFSGLKKHGHTINPAAIFRPIPLAALPQF